MGISICIPVFNTNISSLVAELVKQADGKNFPVEIILVDDASNDAEIKKANRLALQWPVVNYVELEQNKGRAGVRNYLAKLATHKYLLFLDADVMPVSSRFLEKYEKAMAGNEVVIGGITYRPEKPDDQYLLRWCYGHYREKTPVKCRSKHPHRSLLTGNFMIKKDVLLQVAFDESITGYGHEDTLLGIELKLAGIPVVHIDNPVYHDGLETNEQFLQKTRSAIDNLHQILRSHPQRKLLTNQIKLLKTARFTQKTGVSFLIKWWFKQNKKQVEHRLSSQWPCLRLFDFYKLGYFLSKK